MSVLKRGAYRRAAFLATLILALPATAQDAGPRQGPSGYPVPRYVTLKFGEVNARAGPGDDHRLLWIYRTRGLPVQVVAETSDWRRVCDPEGGKAWVHKRVTDGRRAVINLGTRPQPLLRKPRAGAETAAFLGARALASLDRCDKGWCRVKADRTTGWVRQGALWGTTDTPQCR
ncbi:SH3 domain-containing protein [Phenylobacterium sp.]|uniref:SH3 domain-containing protein n=1 Tax=Phenylobacterium sp. TaxID=1871053 RepID=UPI00301DE8C0